MAPKYKGLRGSGWQNVDSDDADAAAAKANASMWAHSDGNYWGAPHTSEHITSGMYMPTVSNSLGPVLVQAPTQLDELLQLPDAASQDILDEIEKFVTLREDFAARRLLYKRGILLWGPPGSGKTCTLHLAIQLLAAKHDSIGLLVGHPHTAAVCMQMIRRIEPSRQIIGVMEDLDALTDIFGESEFLSLMDGESQVDNVVFLGTTNYPEKLDARFVDRPSRFDTVKYIGMPSARAREAYIRHKVPEMSDEDVARCVAGTKDFSIAHLRELVVLTQCFHVSIPDALARLQGMRDLRPKSSNSPDKPNFGFLKDKRND